MQSLLGGWSLPEYIRSKSGTRRWQTIRSQINYHVEEGETVFRVFLNDQGLLYTDKMGFIPQFPAQMLLAAKASSNRKYQWEWRGDVAKEHVWYQAENFQWELKSGLIQCKFFDECYDLNGLIAAQHGQTLLYHFIDEQRKTNPTFGVDISRQFGGGTT